MIKTAIIKRKENNQWFCLISEVEKPLKENFEYSKVFQEFYVNYIASFKEYPIRKKDEEKFKGECLKKLDRLSQSKFDSLLSQGIEIDSDLVEIVENGGLSGQLEYATLK